MGRSVLVQNTIKSGGHFWLFSRVPSFPLCCVVCWEPFLSYDWKTHFEFGLIKWLVIILCLTRSLPCNASFSFKFILVLFKACAVVGGGCFQCTQSVLIAAPQSIYEAVSSHCKSKHTLTGCQPWLCRLHADITVQGAMAGGTWACPTSCGACCFLPLS